MYTNGKYPSSRWPGYIKQARARSVEELLPVARVHAEREYAFPALGPVERGDRVLVMTYTTQDPLVYDTVVAALREAGAERVDMLTWSDLGVRDPDERWSCADGWREINDRLGPMLSDGIE